MASAMDASLLSWLQMCIFSQVVLSAQLQMTPSPGQHVKLTLRRSTYILGVDPTHLSYSSQKFTQFFHFHAVFGQINFFFLKTSQVCTFYDHQI